MTEPLALPKFYDALQDLIVKLILRVNELTERVDQLEASVPKKEAGDEAW